MFITKHAIQRWKERVYEGTPPRNIKSTIQAMIDDAIEIAVKYYPKRVDPDEPYATRYKSTLHKVCIPVNGKDVYLIQVYDPKGIVTIVSKPENTDAKCDFTSLGWKYHIDFPEEDFPEERKRVDIYR